MNLYCKLQYEFKMKMTRLDYYEISVPQIIFDELLDTVGEISYMIDMSKYKHLLKRGDVIGILNHPGYGYRNDGKLMWDGEKLVDLEFEIDEYGSVPSIFIVGKEFDSALYWQQEPIYQRTFTQCNFAVVHNNYIYASFDNTLVSNLSKNDDDYVTFDYQRGNNIETWTILTSNVEKYFSGKPILSTNYLYFEYFVDTKEDKLDNKYKHQYFLYDVNVKFTSKPINYKQFVNMVEPILVRHVTSQKMSSQDVMKKNDITSYTFIDYNTLSTWTWESNENEYKLTLIDKSNDKSDFEKFKNIEIATTHDVSTWGNRPPLNMYYYIWNYSRESDFSSAFKNSLKFMVKKYGLIYIDQVITNE